MIFGIEQKLIVWYYNMKEVLWLETRVAVISIVVEANGCIDKLNALLHEYGQYILGRMGIPYKAKNINLISVAIDAPQDIINALTGALGKLDGITAKAAYSKI